MKQFPFNFNGFHVAAKALVRIITLDFAYAITLFPFVFYRSKYGKSNLLVRTEESIHIRQQMECGLVGLFLYFCFGLFYRSWFVGLPALFLFYILYVMFFAYNMLRRMKYFRHIKFSAIWMMSYKDIPFEKEAQNNCNSRTYLNTRKIFSWIHYF